MIHDLTGRGQLEEQAAFVVIGGGTVGLPFAARLARDSGQRVICLESGGEQQLAETHPLNEVVQLGRPYDGADHGRFRALGGTSTRWGGALIPFQQADLAHGGWPVSMTDLDPYVGEVERLFGLEPGPYADPAFPFDLGPNHANRLAKWPPFAKRNVVNLAGPELRGTSGAEVWLNATVCEVRTTGPGAPVSVLARTAAGDEIRVVTPNLVIAAGAIETTRLALLLDRQNGHVVSQASPALGRYFTDHLSIGVAEIEARRRSVLNRIIGFRFGAGGTMRNIRFELAPDAPARDTLPPGFAHVGFDADQPGGFDALRDVFRHLQMRRMAPAGVLLQLLRHAPWLARAVWWRLVHKRLLFPGDSRLVVHMVAQQAPSPDSRITLSPDRTDMFGQPLAQIDWRVSDADVANVQGLAQAFEQTWNHSGFAALGSWTAYGADRLRQDMQHSSGIYHPTGSTRMAARAEDGVVDADLRLFALPQIRLLATSVLPTGGGANPTMMLLLLALRCAQDLANRRAG